MGRGEEGEEGGRGEEEGEERREGRGGGKEQGDLRRSETEGEVDSNESGLCVDEERGMRAKEGQTPTTAPTNDGKIELVTDTVPNPIEATLVHTRILY